MACLAAGRRGREVRRVDGNPHYQPHRGPSAVLRPAVDATLASQTAPPRRSLVDDGRRSAPTEVLSASEATVPSGHAGQRRARRAAPATREEPGAAHTRSPTPRPGG